MSTTTSSPSTIKQHQKFKRRRTVYRIYLRTHDQQVDLASKMNTHSAPDAAAAFEALVNRVDLDGQKIAAVLSHDGGQMAFHRFDRCPGQPDYWRDRLDDIEWPEDQPGERRGGARNGAGRKAQTTDGGPLRRKTVNLDDTTIALLTAFGDNELSEGIRRAARLTAEKG